MSFRDSEAGILVFDLLAVGDIAVFRRSNLSLFGCNRVDDVGFAISFTFPMLEKTLCVE